MSALAASSSRLRLPGARTRNALICLALAVICMREAMPLVRAVAQEGDGSSPALVADSRAPLQSSFNFQGRVIDSGLPVDGTLDMQFKLFSDAAAQAGQQVGTTLTSNVEVENGLFSKVLDFGITAFATGDRRWIQVLARPAGSGGAYVSLGVQELVATPFAQFSAHTAFGQFISGANAGAGLVVNQDGTGTAIIGQSPGGGHGVEGIAIGADNYGVRAFNGTGPAMYAEGSNVGIVAYGDNAVVGYSDAGGFGATYGRNDVGYGVVGDSLHAAHAGVLGRDPNGVGVWGTGANGVKGEGLNGVVGYSQQRGFAGVYGFGASQNCNNNGPSFICYGVIGDASAAAYPGGVGVMGIGSDAGVWARASVPAAYAAIFDGQTHFNGLMDGPGTQLRTVNIRPDVPGIRNLGFDGLHWDYVVANHFSMVSDAREKTGIVDLETGLETVMALRPVEFELISDPGKSRIGLIAQEVQPLLPQVVNGSTAHDSRLSIAYSEIIPVLIKAMQEQQAEIDELTLLVAGGQGSPGVSSSSIGGGGGWLLAIAMAPAAVLFARRRRPVR